MKIRLLSLIFCSILLLSFSSCGEDLPDVSMFDLQEKMVSADNTLKNLSSASSSDDNAKELFKYVSDVDYSKVKSFFVAYSKTGKADEIAVVYMKNTADINEMKSSLQKHIDSRIKLYNQYEPKQAKRVEKAILFTHNNFCVLIISNKNDKVKQAFLNFVD